MPRMSPKGLSSKASSSQARRGQVRPDHCNQDGKSATERAFTAARLQKDETLMTPALLCVLFILRCWIICWVVSLSHPYINLLPYLKNAEDHPGTILILYTKVKNTMLSLTFIEVTSFLFFFFLFFFYKGCFQNFIGRKNTISLSHM